MSILRRTLAGVSTLLVAGTLAAPAQAAAPPGGELRATLEAIHEAGMYGVYSAVRDGGSSWKGASGVADVRTGRPVKPDMVHRVGSISKTFTAVAVLQQVERGKVALDAPVSRYLPDLITGDAITVRMLLNHTSHLADYIPGAFPSLLEGSLDSLEEHRYRRVEPEELVRLGLAFPPTGQPGTTPGSYSNTNYILAGLLLEKVSGMDAERYITRHVIQKAGLRRTSFPRTPRIPGPSSGAYESFYGLFDPPRDFGVYDMSWAGTAGAVVSTMDDLNRFYRELLRGKLIRSGTLAEMQRTVPVAAGGGLIPYGLGIYAADLPCGRFWGHDGAVWGMLTQSLSSPDGSRQISVGLNRAKYQTIDENGQLVPHAIDYAFADHLLTALCGPAQARTLSTPFTPFQADRFQLKR
ncbi:serine hydrolase [Nonomuraea sp. MCN248]|uniref:Serine hydrolase n=1 Tax=Nonomuraea corallina TaxID=2989783 RepID=A0ABT4SJN4_9ACTN|nr:serine hydrolase domain-containing protein [Nonomuraea corallina]MDA0637408.1 serine hydrolase [Nonomuraea corallina]